MLLSTCNRQPHTPYGLRPWGYCFMSEGGSTFNPHGQALLDSSLHWQPCWALHVGLFSRKIVKVLRSTGMKCAEMCCPLWCQQAAIPVENSSFWTISLFDCSSSSSICPQMTPLHSPTMKHLSEKAAQWTMHNCLHIGILAHWQHTILSWNNNTVEERLRQKLTSCAVLSRTSLLLQDESPIKAVWNMHSRSSCMSLS